MQDIEAVVVSKLSTWKLQHLGLWVDIIEPPATPVKPVTTVELMEMEDLANAAKFREIKAKIAQDTSDMAAFNVAQAETERRTHVVMVMHEKAQMQVGKSLLTSTYIYCFFFKASDPNNRPSTKRTTTWNILFFGIHQGCVRRKWKGCVVSLWGPKVHRWMQSLTT